MLRMSTLFLRTLRDDPADAEVPSHRLLVRAGYIRRAAPGIYSWLPLGYRVLRNVERVVREEMDAAGFQEVHFPALLPREPYEATGRWTEYGDNLFRLKDRKGADYLLGPTHEEMFTLLVKDLYSSYKDLPLSIYQIQTKYRDEARPRAGSAARARVRDEGLLLLRRRRRGPAEELPAAPRRLRADLRPARHASTSSSRRCPARWAARPARSSSCPAVDGEDTFVRCTSCDYAANVEAVEVPTPDAVPLEGLPAAHVEDTPGTPTIDTLVAHLNEHLRARGPALARRRHAEERARRAAPPRRHPRAAGRRPCPGDREVDAKRLGAQVEPAEVEPFTEDDFAAHPGLAKGYIGPGALGEREPHRHPLPARPARRRRHPLGHRRRRAGPARASTWSRARLPARAGGSTAPSRPPRCATATPARAAAGRSSPPAASRWATSSSSAASTPRRSGSRCSTRTASSSR